MTARYLQMYTHARSNNNHNTKKKKEKNWEEIVSHAGDNTVNRMFILYLLFLYYFIDFGLILNSKLIKMKSVFFIDSVLWLVMWQKTDECHKPH